MASPAEWHPSGLFDGNATTPYALIILNQPINKNGLDAVIRSATVVVCADGGANRLYAYDHETRSGFNRRLPDAIVGDLDSLADHAEKYYRSKGVLIVQDRDQYSTDFTKSLRWIRQYSRHQTQSTDEAIDVVVLGGLGGRVDQAFSQIHHLYMASQDRDLLHGRIFLLSEQSLSFILDEENVIYVRPGYFEENAGIIPVLGQARITTSGFEWDVQDWETAFGGQMSTSNHIKSDRLEVRVDGNRPLFTMELARSLCAAGR